MISGSRIDSKNAIYLHYMAAEALTDCHGSFEIHLITDFEITYQYIIIYYLKRNVSLSVPDTYTNDWKWPIRTEIRLSKCLRSNANFERVFGKVSYRQAYT